MSRTPMKGGPPVDAPAGWHVYTLRAPGSDVVRYVGMTANPRRRWRLHYSNARRSPELLAKYRSSLALHRWVLDLGVRDERPEMDLVAHRVSAEDARKAEREWIRRLRASGAPLLNSNDGGAGSGEAQKTCGACRGVGHNRRTCPALGSDAGVEASA